MDEHKLAPMDEHKFWTAEEVGGLIRLSDKSVYRLVRTDPSFPVVKVLGTLRFPKDRVIRWLAKRTQGDTK